MGKKIMEFKVSEWQLGDMWAEGCYVHVISRDLTIANSNPCV